VAWYRRTYFNIRIENLVHYFKKINLNRLIYIIILPTYFIYYNELHNYAECFPVVKDTHFLNKHFYNGHSAYSYKGINNRIINEIFDQILSLKLNNTNFNILEFRKLNGEKFP